MSIIKKKLISLRFSDVDGFAQVGLRYLISEILMDANIITLDANIYRDIDVELHICSRMYALSCCSNEAFTNKKRVMIILGHDLSSDFLTNTVSLRDNISVIKKNLTKILREKQQVEHVCPHCKVVDSLSAQEWKVAWLLSRHSTSPSEICGILGINSKNFSKIKNDLLRKTNLMRFPSLNTWARNTFIKNQGINSGYSDESHFSII